MKYVIERMSEIEINSKEALLNIAIQLQSIAENLCKRYPSTKNIALDTYILDLHKASAILENEILVEA